MRIKFFAVLAILFCSIGQAAAQDTNNEAQTEGEGSTVRASVGFGIQYAGLGWQGAKRKDDYGFRIGYGIAGVSGGLDRYINDGLTIGLQGHTSLLITTIGVSANYYFQPAAETGLILGLDVFSINSFLSVNSGAGAFISVGYRY